MSTTLTSAVIGCGVIAPDHIRGYQQCNDVSVKYVCDLIEQKATVLKDRFGINSITTNYQEILDDPEVDCISICTDHGSHASIVRDALNKRKHVLCEKALSSSREGLSLMMSTHSKTPELVFSGVFQHRFDPVYRYVKQLVTKGYFGKVLTGSLQMMCMRTDQYYNGDSWRGTWAHEGGAVLINQSIHYVDLLAWIMGGVKSVSGAWVNLSHEQSMETEDTAVASLEFASGALGCIETTCSSHIEWEPTITIRGTEGSIDIRNARLMRALFKDESRTIEVEKGIQAGVEALIVGSETKTYYGPSHPSQIADFIQAIRNKRAPFVRAQSAQHAIDLVLSIYESYKTGKRITLSSLPDFQFYS